MVNIKYFLLISSIILFVFVFHRWLKRYLRRNDINIPFTYLFPFENKQLNGTELIKFDLPYDASIRAEVVTETGELVTVIFDEKFKQGIHSKALCLADVADDVFRLDRIALDQLRNG